jgi:hypothetical protein
MKLAIATQDRENYGAHDWDGKGVCPQYWKFKGGREYMVEGIPSGVDLEEVVELVRGDIEQNNDYFHTQIIGFKLEADDYLSWFEKSQLEYDGKITYPEPRIEYSEIKAVYDHEYAEWSADADAQVYGEMA